MRYWRNVTKFHKIYPKLKEGLIIFDYTHFNDQTKKRKLNFDTIKLEELEGYKLYVPDDNVMWFAPYFSLTNNQEIKNKFAISLIKGNKKEIEKHKTNIFQKITEKNKEIDQYETNKSFFVSNKSNDPLLKQINKKIEKLVKETDQLKKELKLLNNF